MMLDEKTTTRQQSFQKIHNYSRISKLHVVMAVEKGLYAMLSIAVAILWLYPEALSNCSILMV